MAEPGPIVIFNTTRFRSDAIIVTASTIKTLSLSKLLYAEAAEKMTRMNHELVKGSLRTYASRNNEMKKLLLVTMPKTPGESDLPMAEKEVEAIVDIARKVGSVGKGSITTTVLKQPNAAEVLGQLESYKIVHFACHGISENKNPLNSNLVLLSRDPRSAVVACDRLTVQQISNINTEHAQLAYLSACSTADNSAQDLGDETIHLASGFQLAGFNHVLATMWKSQDKACLEVARGFYSVLFDIQENENGHRRVGTALHEAVKQVRDRRPDKPLTWAPFIHMGA